MLAQSASEAGIRKRYDRPTLRTLRADQAALFLVGYAYVGHRAAIEMMEMLFPLPCRVGDPKNGRPEELIEREIRSDGGRREYRLR
jgi:hypothetical protein